MYEREAVAQENKVKKMKETEGVDEYDIRKQVKVFIACVSFWCEP